MLGSFACIIDAAVINPHGLCALYVPIALAIPYIVYSTVKFDNAPEPFPAVAWKRLFNSPASERCGLRVKNIGYFTS